MPKIQDSTTRSTVCFVASAFERDDVDLIYDRAIRPALRKLNVSVRRVDRVEHNDDIDERIMQLMLTFDICIADLTYARPSVYYEAGFMKGQGKPVVFIARSDHFRARDNDLQGNLRVHFDLQMKNIIPWKSADQTFVNRLTKRVSYVLRQLARDSKQKESRARRDAAANSQEQTFSSLSVSDQLTTMREAVLPMLRRNGFSLIHASSSQIGLILKRWQKKTLNLICFRPVPRLAASLNDTKFVINNVLQSSALERRDSLSRLVSVVILSPLAAFQSRALSHAFSIYTPLKPTLLHHEGTLTRYISDDSEGFAGRSVSVPWVRYVAALPPVKSIPALKQALTELLSEIANLEQSRSRRFLPAQAAPSRSRGNR